MKFLSEGWAQNLDLLRHSRVRGPGGHPEQGPRHLRRLLVPWCPHVRAVDRHTAIHRHRPHENLQYYSKGDSFAYNIVSKIA